uniref:ABC-2 type transporter transmembrane domain-containing protein n=1 Tax=Strigamia maritima TaxID=126957 RepID=T1J7I9_STRMM
MSSYILTQLNIVIIQACILLIFGIEIFKIHNRGSLLLVLIVLFLQGLCGMSLGFMLSTTCSGEIESIMLATFILFPCFAISGILWPKLGMSIFLQKLSLGLPHTLAAESMRWIMLRGKDITWVTVWPGFLSTIAWASVFIILSMIVMRFKQS